ncbi:MAG: dihydrofolate reductase [Akkermansiaceae bacterium]|nr:dihydrofolate reductase [Akkermansiaceae bacterium]MCF7731352.1 dihydrofolate reductase [Akkermansiaceae bacterium]
MPPQLTAIVAMTPARVIGRDGGLPWHLPADLAFFKRTTTGHPIVMGRATYESIGRPLPDRRNLVLTRNRDWTAPGVEVIHSPDELLDLPDPGPRVFIIGGAAIYQLFLPLLDDLLVSHLTAEHPGDTFFPEFTRSFTCVGTLETHPDFTVRHWLKNLPS